MLLSPRASIGPLHPCIGVAAWLLLWASAPVQAALPLASAGAVAPAATVSAPQAPAYATGDAWIDGRLADIDRYAARYPDAFAAELERYAGVPRAYVQGLLAQPGWRAGDAWFACFLGRAVEATCRSVVRARSLAEAEAEADWAAVADGFDAAAGGKAYAALRLSLADSYRRWDRRLQPDAAMKRALAQRPADP